MISFLCSREDCFRARDDAIEFFHPCRDVRISSRACDDTIGDLVEIPVFLEREKGLRPRFVSLTPPRTIFGSRSKVVARPAARPQRAAAAALADAPLRDRDVRES